MSPLKKRLSSSTAMIALAIVPAAANATNGYFAHGYGVRSKAMAGTGVAFSQDAVAAAINPAGLARETTDREFRGFIQYPCARCAGVAYNRRFQLCPG